jgi:hypothetical protein
MADALHCSAHPLALPERLSTLSSADGALGVRCCSRWFDGCRFVAIIGLNRDVDAQLGRRVHQGDTPLYLVQETIANS